MMAAFPAAGRPSWRRAPLFGVNGPPGPGASPERSASYLQRPLPCIYAASASIDATCCSSAALKSQPSGNPPGLPGTLSPASSPAPLGAAPTPGRRTRRLLFAGRRLQLSIRPKSSPFFLGPTDDLAFLNHFGHVLLSLFDQTLGLAFPFFNETLLGRGHRFSLAHLVGQGVPDFVQKIQNGLRSTKLLPVSGMAGARRII